MKPSICLIMTVLAVTIGVTGCKCPQKVAQQEPAAAPSAEKQVPPAASVEKIESVTTRAFALPDVIIYKTKADYSQNVPVGLNDEKTAIVSYPGKTDLKGQLPVLLEHGFLLDKRGINTNVAFLKYTYDEYMALETMPSIAEMFNAILDADPLTEMYICGKVSDFQSGDLAEQLNETLKRCEGKPEAIFKKLK